MLSELGHLVPMYEELIHTSKVHLLQSIVSSILVEMVFNAYYVGLSEEDTRHFQQMEQLLTVSCCSSLPFLSFHSFSLSSSTYNDQRTLTPKGGLNLNSLNRPRQPMALIYFSPPPPRGTPSPRHHRRLCRGCHIPNHPAPRQHHHILSAFSLGNPIFNFNFKLNRPRLCSPGPRQKLHRASPPARRAKGPAAGLHALHLTPSASPFRARHHGRYWRRGRRGEPG